MKKMNTLLLSLWLLFASCGDTDHNPWLGNASTPEVPGAGIVVDKEATLGDLKDGVTIIDDTTLAFVLFAPHKEQVHLVADFNDWKQSDKFKLNKEGDRFWLQVKGFEKEQEYVFQYLIDETIRIADPYSAKVSDPNDKYIDATIYPDLVPYPQGAANQVASVVSTNRDAYNWKVQNFKVEKPENMVIYEMLLRDFTEERSIRAAQAKLPYLKELGINVIELMPFNEFEGNNSWGYNPSYFFAVDKAYGTENAYKEFIDECHNNGIAVVMDMVFNHAYGQCPLVRMYMDGDQVAANNPWFNAKAPHEAYSWGYDFNHESEYTQAFIDKVTAYWMTEYKIDGFRFDFTKGFTNNATTDDAGLSAVDNSRIAILKRMTDEIRKVNSDAIVIFEHLTANEEEKILSDYGIYLWGNMNHDYNEATMGYENNLEWTSYRKRGWSKPTLVAYMESHDEERLMFKNLQYGKVHGDYSVKDLATALNRTAAAAVIYMSYPGPKMIWQFGELGYDYELNDDRLAPKPVRWDYYEVPERKALFDVFATMIELRKTNPVFATTDYEVKDSGYFKQILLKEGSSAVCAVANFDVINQTNTVNFGSTGEWKEQFTGETINVTSAQQSIELAPGEYRLYIK